MADLNQEDFYRRVDAIRAGKAQGHGFEAPGTLGRSYYTRRPRRRIPLLGPLAVTLIVFMGLKGVLHAQLGAATYDQRIAAVAEEGTAGRIGAFLMRADLPTLWISAQVRTVLRF